MARTKKEKDLEASLAKPSPSAAPEEQRDEVIKLDDGTDYRTVAGRKAKFSNDYPNGSISVNLITDPNNKEYFVIKAIVWPDAKDKERTFSAYGQCERIAGDKFASLEKAETTAIGRALSHMATTILGAGASQDEIDKASGKSNLQLGIRESIKEGPATTHPKAEPTSEGLKGEELSQYNDWSISVIDAKTKEELIELGKRIKEANLSKRATEELRKLFNKQLRSFASEEKSNATA